ncbi:SPOR domain-containing protein [Dongia rigui]|uniref:SPOR domain-containing protein n=1 Tax=Dongia rigui TaxID=940149 RepID=A0ABU5DSB2_9PROT|nr:SPOR domain-containing protein [Dongia rigui]MDY0870299.1 SPOR domain-containing protein [Dongia rigui]
MTTEPPRPDQIQANVAAALSRLRGELAPTPPVAAGGSEPDAGRAGDTDSEPQLDVGPTLSAPDPSMALGAPKPHAPSDPLDTPFARMTGLKPTDQPDLLSGIGAPPPLADIADAEAEAAHRRRRLRNRLLAGGVLVLALAGFWYWSSSGEGGSEAVPVIAADGTPEKVKPADEGGLEVPNQDVAILNGENSAAPSQGETVLPAPEQPATPPAPPAEPAAPSDAAPAATADAAPAASDAVPSVAAPAVDAIPSVPAPTEPGVATSGATPPAAPATSEAAPVPAEEPTQTAAAEAAPVEAAPAAEAAPAPATSGSARIQLAAVKSEAAAQKEWTRLQKANPDLLGGLSLHVERFNKSASEVYYRIQAGPLADKAAAKQLCAQLKQKNQACLVAN